MLKTLLSKAVFAAAVAGAMFVAAPAAEAKVNVWIGAGPYPYWNGPGYYGGHYHHWISCGAGARIVDHNGYYAVRAMDCSPPTYSYRAKRNGHLWVVRVNARYGHIISARRY